MYQSPLSKEDHANFMRIQYSSLPALEITSSSDKARDYTKEEPVVEVKKVSKAAEFKVLLESATRSVCSESIFSQPEERGSPVVIVSNVPDVTAVQVFKLFGHYGNVQRVKVTNKNDQRTSFVEFESQSQAQMAIEMLSGLSFMGKTIVVNFSKHSRLKLGKSDTYS